MGKKSIFAFTWIFSARRFLVFNYLRLSQCSLSHSRTGSS